MRELQHLTQQVQAKETSNKNSSTTLARNYVHTSVRSGSCFQFLHWWDSFQSVHAVPGATKCIQVLANASAKWMNLLWYSPTNHKHSVSAYKYN